VIDREEPGGLWDWLGLRDRSLSSWQRDALCAQVDPEIFFPEKGASTLDAKRVCAGCPVRAQCLAAALERGERFGVWGGLAERERRVMRTGRVAA
jgi:WhiB family redox-sensing transcriptional regulator